MCVVCGRRLLFGLSLRPFRPLPSLVSLLSVLFCSGLAWCGLVWWVVGGSLD